MRFIFCIVFALLLFLVRPVFGQNDSIDIQYAVADTLHESFGLFDSDEMLLISLRFDITKYLKKRSDIDYLDAILTYHTGDNDSINREIKVKARGEFRRTYCHFPPLLLNFKMNDSIEGEFSRIDKIKMVTHCKSGSEENLFKEYLIYKLYNVITENSLRVRLLKVNYIDTFKDRKPISEYAFVIEPVDLFGKRTNSVEVKSTKLTQKNIKPEMMDRMAIFNYMIGNTDWSVPIDHNIIVMAQASSDRPDLGMILPYDFDYSGLINTSYAIPYDGLGIKSVLERRYVGICRSKEVFINALNEFAEKKEELYKVINDFPFLKEKSKKRMIIYLDGFFNGIDKRNTLVYNLLEGCLNF